MQVAVFVYLILCDSPTRATFLTRRATSSSPQMFLSPLLLLFCFAASRFLSREEKRARFPRFLVFSQKLLGADRFHPRILSSIILICRLNVVCVCVFFLMRACLCVTECVSLKVIQRLKFKSVAFYHSPRDQTAAV